MARGLFKPPRYENLPFGTEKPRKNINFTTIYSSPYSNQGRLNKKEMSFLQNNTEFDKVAKPLYTEYQRLHPFLPSPKAIENPLIMNLERERYGKRALKWMKEQEPSRISEMLWKGWKGFNASKEPKGGAKLSSSWVKNVKVTGDNTLSIKLGNKNYQYGFSSPRQLKQFLQCDSIGGTVAYLRNKPAGTSKNGIKKLW